MSLTLALFFLGAQGALPEGPLVFGGFSGEFFANGSYRIEGEGWTPLAGSFHLPGSELVLASPEGASECTGLGRYSFAVEAGRLTLRLAADDCTPRRMILDGSVWRRAPKGNVSRTPHCTELRRDPAFHPRCEERIGKLALLPRAECFGCRLWTKPSRRMGRRNRKARSGKRRSKVSPIPARSSGARVFVTSAVSSREGASFRPGLYGDGDASDDRSRHQWILSAFDKRTGVLLWKQVAYEGVPIDKRHIKSTYASATPATDGRIVVASFGSQGLHAYDVEGEFLWKVDVGRLNLGAYDIPTFEWGPASSPILWGGMVFLQCDTQHDSFLLALDAESGKTLWKAERDELPSWATPFVYDGASGFELVTNAPNFIRGYDPGTGQELWRLGGSSKITAPTPVAADGFIVVASGRRPEQPIFVVRAGSRGDLTLGAGRESSAAVAWSRTRRGPYMPTPLVYDGILYVLGNNGVFDAYQLESGKEIYRQRIPHLGSGLSTSPLRLSRRQVDLRHVAGDDRLGVVAEPRQEHLHLLARRVLRFVEDHEGVVERAPAHEGERRHLDHPRSISRSTLSKSIMSSSAS